jgi:DNA-binding transcriptional regulator YiaG
MTAAQYRAAIETLGLSQGAAADFLGVSLRTSWRWANGAPIPVAVAKLLNLMVEAAPQR